MVDMKDVNTFTELLIQAKEKLPERTLLPVVHQRLYLSKGGVWEVRCLMTGYSIGQPSLGDLLKQYVFAVSGITPTEEQMQDAAPMILERLTESLRQAIATLSALELDKERLKEIKNGSHNYLLS